MAKDAGESGVSVDERYVPVGLRVAAAWSWRLAIVVLVLIAAAFAISQLRIIVIPVMIAVLLTALLRPLVLRLHVAGLSRGLSVIIAVVGLIAVVTGLVWLIVWQLQSGLSDLTTRTQSAINQFRDWLFTSPLHLTEAQIDAYLTSTWKSLQSDSRIVLTGALSVGSTAGHVFAGVLLTLFSTIFLLYDTRTIFRWLLNLLPRRARASFGESATRGWRTLSDWVRVQILVAAIDAVGIGIGAAILQLPMVIPMSILVFLGSFIPFVGALVSGVIVCVVALIYNGWISAIVMLGIVLLVQQVEGHVLQPFIMGHAVKVHPLGVVLSVAIGTLIAGIPGALFAVPVVAVANTMIAQLVARHASPPDAPPTPRITVDHP